MKSLVKALPIAIMIAMGGTVVAPAIAQDTAQKQADTEDKEPSNTRQAIAWSRDRLAELDADIAILEKDAARKKGEARAEAQAAISDLREIRDGYRESSELAVKNARTWSDEQVLRAEKDLDDRWARFQAGVDDYLEETKANVATRRALLDAELKVRREAWRKRIAELRADADGLAAAERDAINARIDALKVQTDASKERVARLQGASRESWGVAKQGYADMQQTFSNTYARIRKSIEDAAAKDEASGEESKNKPRP